MEHWNSEGDEVKNANGGMLREKEAGLNVLRDR